MYSHFKYAKNEPESNYHYTKQTPETLPSFSEDKFFIKKKKSFTVV